MANSADPDQLASEEANWSGICTVCKGRIYPGSTGLGLMSTHNICFYGEQEKIVPKFLPNTLSYQALLVQLWVSK